MEYGRKKGMNSINTMDYMALENSREKAFMQRTGVGRYKGQFGLDRVANKFHTCENRS